jgi:hypothetical protein
MASNGYLDIYEKLTPWGVWSLTLINESDKSF